MTDEAAQRDLSDGMNRCPLLVNRAINLHPQCLCLLHFALLWSQAERKGIW